MENLTLAYIIGGSLILLVSIAIITGKNIALSLKDFFSFSVGSGEKKKKASPHSTCRHLPDAMWNIETLLEHYKELSKMDNLGIKVQMEIMEAETGNFIAILRGVFLKLLMDMGEENPSETIAFRNYENTLSCLKQNIIDNIRPFVIENGFSEMSEQEFSYYVEERKKELMSRSSEIMNNLYVPCEGITRVQLYEANYGKTIEFDNIIERAFQRCRVAAKRVSAKKQEKKDAIQGIMNYFKGVE